MRDWIASFLIAVVIAVGVFFAAYGVLHLVGYDG